MNFGDTLDESNMGRNIEIKARIIDFAQTFALAKSIAGADPLTIEQEDVFFAVPRGRLKLRKCVAERAELIYYERADAEGPSLSKYVRTPVTDEDTLRQLLASSLGIRGIVRKRRYLFMVRDTRVHLDLVEELGSFLELEVVMHADWSKQYAIDVAEALMRRFRIEKAQLIAEAYIDLLLRQPPHESH